MKNTHIKKDVGLGLVVGAFALAFFATGPATLQLNAQMVNNAVSLHEELSSDRDHDGITDQYDAYNAPVYTSATLEALRAIEE